MIFFERNVAAPLDLVIEKEKNGTWRTESVYETLALIFKDKCYICESLRPLGGVNVEHFIPHKGDKNLMFDWNNLFFACGHCNNIKGDLENIIDCTDPHANIEGRLKLQFNDFKIDEIVVNCLDDLPQTKNTGDLLIKVYNGSTPNKKLQSSYIRFHISKELDEFSRLINDFQITRNKTKKAMMKHSIIKALKKDTAYTSFKRWIIRDNPILKAEFEEYFD